MARTFESHTLVSTIANAHQQTADLASERSIVLDPTCTAVMIDARGPAAGVVNVTFDGTSPSTTNGLAISIGAQPLYIPLGRHNGNQTFDIKVLGAAGQTLDVLQLA